VSVSERKPQWPQFDSLNASADMATPVVLDTVARLLIHIGAQRTTQAAQGTRFETIGWM
jgi:hypothetical protein